MNYDSLSVDELNEVVKHLTSRLELAKAALTTKQEPPKMVAQKRSADSSYPDLPWTNGAHRLASDSTPACEV